MRFELLENNQVTNSGDGKAILNDRTLTIQLPNGIPIKAPYYKILRINDVDYKVNLELDSYKVNISQLGYEYENFLKNLYRLRGELLLNYMLMNEAFIGKGIEAHFLYTDPSGITQEGECEARIYESAVIALPEKADPIRIPLCYITNLEQMEYIITVSAEKNEKIILSQMGEKTDYFARSISKALSEMEARAYDILNSLAPITDPRIIKQGALLMSDGKAASESEIKSLDPRLWLGIEESIYQAGLTEEYKYLSNLSKPGKIYVGIKRGLMGEKTGQYLWLMAPIYNANKDEPGNTLILEAASDDVSTRATYLFNIIDREKYNSSLNSTDLEVAVENFIKTMNRCLIEINFRREPIYITEDKLQEPDYERYLYAAYKMSSLQLLRKNFLGRVFHASPEKWRNDIATLIEEKR